ncbi:MAG: YraN family protein [Patescibacteria group bacterium]
MITDKRKIGNFGEKIAEDFLKKKKYKIIARNFQNKFGEIDLIAHDKKGKQLVFVEVKLKRDNKFGLPEEEFNFHKKRKLKRVINSFLSNKKMKEENWRVDLIAIEFKKDLPVIRHYQAVEI